MPQAADCCAHRTLHALPHSLPCLTHTTPHPTLSPALPLTQFNIRPTHFKIQKRHTHRGTLGHVSATMWLPPASNSLSSWYMGMLAGRRGRERPTNWPVAAAQQSTAHTYTEGAQEARGCKARSWWECGWGWGEGGNNRAAGLWQQCMRGEREEGGCDTVRRVAVRRTCERKAHCMARSQCVTTTRMWEHPPSNTTPAVSPSSGSTSTSSFTRIKPSSRRLHHAQNTTAAAHTVSSSRLCPLSHNKTQHYQ